MGVASQGEGASGVKLPKSQAELLQATFVKFQRHGGILEGNRGNYDNSPIWPRLRAGTLAPPGLYNNCGPLGDAWASQEILGPPALGHPWVSMGILEGPMDLLDASQLKLSGKS